MHEALALRDAGDVVREELVAPGQRPLTALCPADVLLPGKAAVQAGSSLTLAAPISASARARSAGLRTRSMSR